ncbi:hypothetical protein HQ576_15015 [bacterium]|nr:hypothetical protein [bacterium]
MARGITRTRAGVGSLALLCLAMAGCGGKGDAELAAGPWLLGLTHDEVIVAWETADIADGTLECWTADGLLRAHHPHRVRVHQLRLAGLKPDTLYHYRIASGGSRSAPLAFRTLPAKCQKFTFAVYGGAALDSARHADLARLIARTEPSVVVYTGGYSQTEDGAPADAAALNAGFLAPAREVFARHPVMALRTRDAGRDFGPRLLPGDAAPWRSYRLGHAELFALDVAEGVAEGSPQREWLRSALSHSTAWWKFVVCQQPPLSAVADDRAAFRRALLPLLLDAGVDALFTGGALRERSVPLTVSAETHAVRLSCFATAAAGALGTARAVPWAASVKAEHAWLLVMVDGARVDVSVRDLDGREVDKAVLEKSGEPHGEKGLPAGAIEAFLAFAPVGGFAVTEPGDQPTATRFVVPVTNPYGAALQGEVRWEVNADSGWSVEPAVIAVDVPPRATRRCPFTATVRAGAARLAPSFAFVVDGQELTARQSPLRLEPRPAAMPR